MLRKKFTRAAALLAVAVLAAGRAVAGPELPPKAIADDTFLVVHVNASKVSPENVDQSLQALLGPQAALAQAGLT